MGTDHTRLSQSDNEAVGSRSAWFWSEAPRIWWAEVGARVLARGHEALTLTDRYGTGGHPNTHTGPDLWPLCLRVEGSESHVP